MFARQRAPGSKSGQPVSGRRRTRRHMQQQYGDYVPLTEATKWQTFKAIAIFAVFGLIFLGTLYWIFG